MPGLSLIAATEILSQKADDSFALLKHLPKFNIENIISNKNIAAAFVGYDGYPILYFDDPDRFILVEGMIYNFSDDFIRTSLNDIAVQFRKNIDYQDSIRRFMADADGDYIILIYLRKENRLLLFNDRWGRLPFYYLSSDKTLAMSREVKFILEWIPAIQYDVYAMAEFLTLEYILGDKTFFRDIHRLGPASVITAEISETDIKASVSREIIAASFRNKAADQNRKQAAEQYLELFRQSLKWRVDKLSEKKLPIVSDLSGGYDTRAVFAGLCELGADFTACSDRLITGDETDTARRLAQLYDREVCIMEAEHPIDNIDEMTRLLYITDGLVNALIDTSCFYDDLEREKKIPGPFVNFKGMGGEFIRWVYMPKKGYRHLADAIIDDGYNHYMNIAQAFSLLGLEKDDLRSNLKSEIDRYNEPDPIAQTRHLFFDYNNKTVNTGEDRNRLFCWTVAPLWGNHLISFASEMIPSRFIDHDFFALFLKLLSPESLKVPMYGSGVRYNSIVSRMLFRYRMKIKRIIRDNRYLFKTARRIRQRLRPKRYIASEHARLAGIIREIYDKCETVRFHLDFDALDGYLKNNQDRFHLYQLLTLILYMNEIEKRYRSKMVIKR